MRIAVTSQDTFSDFFFDDEPWSSFANAIYLHGHEIVNWKEKPDVVIFNNFSKRIFRRISPDVPASKRFLIVWEPPCNAPRNFNGKNRTRFAKVLFPSPIWAENFGGESFPWPQETQIPKNGIPWLNRTDKFCLIQANRWRISRSDKYTLRRQLLSECPEQIDLFGRNWNQGVVADSVRLIKSIPDSILEKSFSVKSMYGIGANYPNFKGTPISKIDVLHDYRFSLVIENSNEYVSEKLVDAILAGTIPLYVGADLSKFGFSEKIAKVCLPNVLDIKRAMRDLQNDQELQKLILRSGQEFLHSKFFNSLNNRAVLANLAKEVCGYIS